MIPMNPDLQGSEQPDDLFLRHLHRSADPAERRALHPRRSNEVSATCEDARTLGPADHLAPIPPDVLSSIAIVLAREAASDDFVARELTGVRKRRDLQSIVAGQNRRGADFQGGRAAGDHVTSLTVRVSRDNLARA